MKKNNINNLKQTDFIQILMFANGENEYFFGITKDNMFTFMDYNNILKVSATDYLDLQLYLVDEGYRLVSPDKYDEYMLKKRNGNFNDNNFLGEEY